MPNTNGLVAKKQYDSDKQSLEKKTGDGDTKVPNGSRLVKKTDYNINIIEIEKNKLLVLLYLLY